MEGYYPVISRDVCRKLVITVVVTGWIRIGELRNSSRRHCRWNEHCDTLEATSVCICSHSRACDHTQGHALTDSYYKSNSIA